MAIPVQPLSPLCHHPCRTTRTISPTVIPQTTTCPKSKRKALRKYRDREKERG
ncbi:hypothetical protein SESBI_08229 [Sesbania bispinosa]|nr:hypothetical protein SESBI_08229 [Sesbania bispinosa]